MKKRYSSFETSKEYTLDCCVNICNGFDSSDFKSQIFTVLSQLPLITHSINDFKEQTATKSFYICNSTNSRIMIAKNTFVLLLVIVANILTIFYTKYTLTQQSSPPKQIISFVIKSQDKTAPLL